MTNNNQSISLQLTSSASEAALIVAPQGVYGRRERREDGAMVVEEKYILGEWCIV